MSFNTESGQCLEGQCQFSVPEAVLPSKSFGLCTICTHLRTFLLEKYMKQSLN